MKLASQQLVSLAYFKLAICILVSSYKKQKISCLSCQIIQEKGKKKKQYIYTHLLFY